MVDPHDDLERRRELDRERGRRYRERHRERVRLASLERVKKYQANNPDKVAEQQRRCRVKAKERVNQDPYAAALSKQDLFWAKVEKRDGECWPWRGTITVQGYGRFNLATGKWMPASRVSLMLSLGRSLRAGEFACHHCDNPPCCNPSHLYAGSQAQNMADKVKRNRSVPRGGHKIDKETAMMIRLAEGTQTEIAERYGVSRSYVSMVKAGKKWARLAQPTTHA